MDVSPNKQTLYLGFGYGIPVFVREAEIAMADGTKCADGMCLVIFKVGWKAGGRL